MSQDRDEIGQLRQYIRDETGHPGEIDPSVDLIEAGILDSFSIVSLAVFAQETFGVEFEPEELVRENLARLNALQALIRRHRVD